MHFRRLTFDTDLEQKLEYNLEVSGTEWHPVFNKNNLLAAKRAKRGSLDASCFQIFAMEGKSLYEPATIG